MSRAAREERETALRKQKQRRLGVTSDVRNRVSQAFWAMHAEAINWSAMGVRAYAGSMQLSPHLLRKWRDRLDAGEVAIDWRAHLHPSVRPAVSTRKRQCANGLLARHSRRFDVIEEPYGDRNAWELTDISGVLRHALRYGSCSRTWELVPCHIMRPTR